MKVVKISIITFCIFLCCNTVFAQRTHNHTVHFRNMDGFTGYVNFKTLYEGFATQLKANSGEMVITGYDVSQEEIDALNKAGLNLRRTVGSFRPDKFTFEVEGQAYINRGTYGGYNAKGKSKLSLGNSSGDYTTPSFSEDMQNEAKEWQERNKGESYWESFGGFSAEKVTALYLSDLKAEINRILSDYRSSKQAFEATIHAGTSAANGFDFDRAEVSLGEAKQRSNGTSDHREQISTLERLIATKKREKEAEDKKEADALAQKQQEADKQASADEGQSKGGTATSEGQADSGSAASSGGTASSGSGSSGAAADSQKDSDENESSDGKSGSRTVYIPKTATQMHAELKAMTDRNPAMLNDPNVRQRLRYLEVDANREQQTTRDYRSGVYNANSTTLSQYIASNRKIDTYSKAAGDITDAVGSAAVGIVDAIDRRRQEKRSNFYNAVDDAKDRQKAIRSWEYQLREERKEYESDVVASIRENGLVLVSIVANGNIEYETEVMSEPDYNKQIPPKFTKQKKIMSDGQGYMTTKLYVVENDGVYGVLDDAGEAIYPPQFDDVYVYGVNVLYPRIALKIMDKWGEIDRNGKLVEEVKYDNIYYLDNDVKLLRQGEVFTMKNLDPNSVFWQKVYSKEELIKEHFPAQLASLNERDQFLDIANDKVISIPVKFSKIRKVSKELFAVMVNDKIGIFDNNGKDVTPLKYEDVWNFEEGLIAVKLDGKIGFIDNTGKEVTPLKYDGHWNFQEGLAAVKINGKIGFIDNTGKEVTPLKYDKIWDFQEGLAAVEINGKIGLIDNTGKEVTPLKYDATGNFEQGIAIVKLNDKFGFINSDGVEVTPLKYDDILRFSDEYLLNVKLNDVWGVLDKTGQEIIRPKYESMSELGEGFFGFIRNGKWGVIDTNDNTIIFPEYEDLGCFFDGLLSVKLKGRWGVVDKSNKVKISPKYEEMYCFSNNGLSCVKLNGKWGFVNVAGKEVITIKYEDALPFIGGSSRVKLNGEVFYIDANGSILK